MIPRRQQKHTWDTWHLPLWVLPSPDSHTFAGERQWSTNLSTSLSFGYCHFNTSVPLWLVHLVNSEVVACSWDIPSGMQSINDIASIYYRFIQQSILEFFFLITSDICQENNLNQCSFWAILCIIQIQICLPRAFEIICIQIQIYFPRVYAFVCA